MYFISTTVGTNNNKSIHEITEVLIGQMIEERHMLSVGLQFQPGQLK